MRSILGLIFAFLTVTVFFLQGLTNYADNGIQDVAKVHNKLVQYKTAPGLHVPQRFELSNHETEPHDTDRNSIPGQVPVSFIYSQEFSVEDIDPLQHIDILTVILPKVSEDDYSSYISVTSFDQSPIENIILSSLQTVVLLN